MLKNFNRWVCALTLLGAPQISQAADAVKNGGPTQFEIMIWSGTPGSPEALKRVKEGGITIAGNLSTGQARDGMLDMVKAAGLKAFVWPELNEVEGLMKDDKISKHEALAGYLIGSEFNSTALPELAKANQIIKQSLPNKIPLMNLFPAYVYPTTVKAASFQAFLDDYVATCKPTVLCYDHYALMEDGTFNPTYWQSLETFRAKALESNIPFWNVVQAVGHMQYREPTAADFLFQAYSTVAYGGRGLAYFTYSAYPVGNYRGAPIDQFGNETPAWQSMANANHQILSLAPTLMKLKSDAVYHFGDVPEFGHGPTETSLIRDAAGNLLVGDFTHEDGSRYVMIVNKSLTKSVFPSVKYRDPAMVEVGRVSPYREGKVTEPYDEDRYLAPGQGILFKLGKK